MNDIFIGALIGGTITGVFAYLFGYARGARDTYKSVNADLDKTIDLARKIL